MNIADAIDVLLDELARRITTLMRSEDERRWISQKGSPLGRNRHCACVRERITLGLPGASVIGKQYLLTPDALREEMRGYGAAPDPATAVPTRLRPTTTAGRRGSAAQPEQDELAAFEAELEAALRAIPPDANAKLKEAARRKREAASRRKRGAA